MGSSVFDQDVLPLNPPPKREFDLPPPLRED